MLSYDQVKKMNLQGVYYPLKIEKRAKKFAYNTTKYKLKFNKTDQSIENNFTFGEFLTVISVTLGKKIIKYMSTIIKYVNSEFEFKR